MSNKKFPLRKVTKKNAKASVFTHLFSIPRYKKDLYLSLHPKDKKIKEEEIKIWTLFSVFTNIQLNDLGLLVRNKILLLMEAQSTWTFNILPRILEYLGESFNRYVLETRQNIYGSKKVTLPKPELYVLYTGCRYIKEKEISFNKEFFDNDSPIDLVVKVVTIKNSSSILKDYIDFSKVFDKNNKKYRFTKESINKTIDYCIKHNILKDYLNKYKKEVYNIMTSIYSQETATYMYGNERYAAGKADGKKEGRIETFISLVKEGLMNMKEAAKRLGMSEKEFNSLVGT